MVALAHTQLPQSVQLSAPNMVFQSWLALVCGHHHDHPSVCSGSAIAIHLLVSVGFTVGACLLQPAHKKFAQTVAEFSGKLGVFHKMICPGHGHSFAGKWALVDEMVFQFFLFHCKAKKAL